MGLGTQEALHQAEHKLFAKMKKEVKKVTLKQDEGKTQLKPYCVEAEKAALQKEQAELLRPQATEYLKNKLDSDAETKDFKGTVVYLCDDQVYKIRVQRPRSCNWRKKRLSDPNLREYKQLMAEIDERKNRCDQLEELLAADHPRCVQYGFVIAFLHKTPNAQADTESIKETIVRAKARKEKKKNQK